MRGLNSLPLDDDIIDRILLFLPTFSALRALLLSSKSFSDVFKHHPHSIIRAIAYNITGPALPQAMRFLRATRDSDLASDPLKILSTGWTETDSISPITHDEARNIVKIAAVVNPLEDLFSSRHKDRTSQSSKLDSLESWRFRRAIYRLMLFAAFFPADDVDFDAEAELAEIEQERSQRKQLLSEFSDCELREIHGAASFLHELVSWIATCDTSHEYELNPFQGLALAHGPAIILEAYRSHSLDEISSPLEDSGIDTVPEIFQDYIFLPLQKIWEERKLKPPIEDGSRWESILDDIHGANDACHQCGTVRGFDLWNETCWEYLRGLPSTNQKSLPSLIKGNLHHNLQDAPLLEAEISAQTFTYTKLLREIHQLRVSTHVAWDTQDWLCEQCITGIVQTHLHFWLLEQKKKAGQQIHEDCWYGYDCRTQTHRLPHAQRRNHLCEPTRGSA